MKTWTFIVLVTVGAANLLVCASPLTSIDKPPPSPERRRRKSQKRADRFLSKLYDKCDTNKDGTISFVEAYELVLRLYVKINRKAPIPVPSRIAVLKLFLKYDVDKNNEINREEFDSLARVLGRRALSRLVAHKMVTLFGAPLLAELTLRKLFKDEWFPSTLTTILPEHYHENVLPVVTSKQFCRTALLILFVATLANVVLSTVNWLLEMSLPSEEEYLDSRWDKYHTA